MASTHISVSMIVKNEEACLAACLESVRGADELVIVDTGSTDRTKEIAESFGAKLYDFPWIDDFAAARNFSLSKCTGDWVFIIDADWTLAPDGMARIRAAAQSASADTLTISVGITTRDGRFSHRQPLLFRRCPQVYWKGAIHNYLSVAQSCPSDIEIFNGYSPAHNADPDRALRILTKELERDPTLVRETYYLAREYWYRRDYATAVKWYDDYLSRAMWPPEMADAWLMKARCLWGMQKGEQARDACLQAIKINANFKEAELFMAALSGPKNRARWRQIAETATNKDVLFVRSPAKGTEKGAEFYDRCFANDTDLSRYRTIYERISAIAGNARVLDIGCGPAILADYIERYAGFDFAEQTIANARAKGRHVWVGNSLEKSSYKDADLYVATEVLEHIDNDIKVIENIPSGKNVVFSVPSFNCEGHVRTYDEATVVNRYAPLLDIQKISIFVWQNNRWTESDSKTEPFILLVEAIRR